MKIPVEEIQHIDFVETPTKQSSHGQLHNFDIIYDFPLKDGIDHKRYCVLLLRTFFSIKKKERILFLEYQCHQVEKPFRWMNSLYMLLEYNYRVLIRQKKNNRFAEIIDLVEEKRNALFYLHGNARDSTLEQLAKNENKKYRWHGTANQLVHMYYQTIYKTHKGDALLKLTTQEIVELIQERYVKKDGSLFNSETLRSYLKPSKADKHPNLDQQIQVSDTDEE